MLDRESGLRVKSWGDVVAVSTLLAMLLAVIMWGLKLESELNVERQINTTQAAEIAELKAQVGNGILPRAEERITSLERRMDRHDERTHE